MLAAQSSLSAQEVEETRERDALQTHEHIIAICLAIAQHQPRASQGPAFGESAELTTIVDAVLDIFQGCAPHSLLWLVASLTLMIESQH